jgi:hypothetical protein
VKSWLLFLSIGLRYCQYHDLQNNIAVIRRFLRVFAQPRKDAMRKGLLTPSSSRLPVVGGMTKAILPTCRVRIG